MAQKFPVVSVRMENMPEFPPFWKLFSGMSCNIKISFQNFWFLLANGKHSRQVRYIRLCSSTLNLELLFMEEKCGL